MALTRRGAFCGALAIVTVRGTATRAGVDISIVRFIGAAEGKNQGVRIQSVTTRALTLTIPLTLLASLVLFFAGDNIAAHVFKKEALGHVLVMMGLALPGITLLTVYGMGLQGLHRTVRSGLTLKIAGPVMFIAMHFRVSVECGDYLD